MSNSVAVAGEEGLAREPLRLAVLGSPIAHSQSPLLHRTAYAALGLRWEYGLHDVTTDALPAFVAELSPPWRGLSLTMPLKETILAELDSIDTIGTAAGAVNTVLVTHGDGRRRLAGFNTDVYGIREALTRAGISQTRRTLVIGGGATARSAVVAAGQLGCEQVDVVLRSSAKAGDVVAAARAAGVSSTVTALHDPALAAFEPDLTISTLPGGVGVSANFLGSTIAASSALLDVAYHPWPSELAGVWEAQGNLAVPGLSMLVHQAVAQIRVFLRGDPLLKLDDEERITAAMLDAVGLDAAGRIRS